MNCFWFYDEYKLNAYLYRYTEQEICLLHKNNEMYFLYFLRLRISLN